MSGKKKRMGSHRRSNQSKMDTESLHVEESASAAELIEGERSEANVLASPDNSQSTNLDSPSSELTGNRRKLGSSRKKGRGHVKDSVTESYHKPREDLEEDTKDKETLESNMLIETPKYREVNDPSEHDGDNSLVSLPVPDVSDVLKNQQEAYDVKETDSGLVSDINTLEEPKMESIDVSLSQRVDVASESACYVDNSPFHTSAAIGKSSHMEVSDVASPILSLTEKQNRERDDADLLRQDKPFHANPFAEVAETPAMSGLSTKENLREHTDIECSIEEETPKEEINLDEEQSELINLSEVKGAHQSEDDLTEREVEAAQMQDVQPILFSSESVTEEASDTGSVKLTDQLKLNWVNSDEDQVEDDIQPTAERVVHEMKDLSEESSLKILNTEINAPLTSQHQDMLEKQPDTDFHTTMNRRKLGSSRRNKGRHHPEDSATESQNQNKEDVQENTENETGGTGISDEVVMQERTVITVLEGMDTPEDVADVVKNDAHPVDIPELIHLNVKLDPTVDQQLIDQSKSTEIAQEECHSVGNKHFNLSEVGETPPSTAIFNEKDTETTKIQDTHSVVVTSETVTHETMDSSDINSMKLTDQAEVSDAYQLTIKSTEYSSTLQDVSSPNKDEQSITHSNLQTLDYTKEDYNTREPQITNLGSGGTEVVQVYEAQDQLESVLKPTTEEVVHDEMIEVPSEDVDRDPSLPTTHTDINAPLASQHQDMLDKQPDTDFHTTMIHHAKDSATESQNENKEEVQENAENETGGRTEILSDEVTMQEQTVKTVLEEIDTSEDVTHGIKDDAHLVDISELIDVNIQLDPTVDQQLADQSKSTEIAQEELHSVGSATDPQYQEKHEETEVSTHDRDSYASNLLSESHVKLEGVDFLLTQDITAEKPSLSEHFDTVLAEVDTSANAGDEVKDTVDFISIINAESGPTADQQLIEIEYSADEEKMPLQDKTTEDGGARTLVEVRENHNAEPEGSVSPNVPVHVEVELQHEAPAVKETHTLVEVTHTELFPFPQNVTKTVTQFDTFLEENLTAEASTEKSSISEAGDECKDHKTPDQSENLQITPQQKRRKMGSTRRAQMNRKQEKENETEGVDFNTDIDGRDCEKTKVVEELLVMLMESEKPLQSETQKESSTLEEEHKSPSNETIDLMAAIPLQVPPHGETVVNPVMFANAVSVSNSEKNEDDILNISQPVDFTSAEIHTPSVVDESSSITVNQLLPTNTENAGIISVHEMSQSTQNYDKLPNKECEDRIEQKALKSAELPTLEIVKEEAGESYNTLDNMRELKILHEGASNINTEIKYESPDRNLTNRRRKMGSTRKSLGTRPKGEELNEKQADSSEDTEKTTHAGEMMTHPIYGIKEKELQLQTEHEDGDSEQGTNKGFETVDYSNISDTCKTSLPQQLDDESHVSQGSLKDSDQIISDDLPGIPAASFNLEAMSESAVGGRRRKMGSHRRSRDAQTTKQGEITDTQNRSDARTVKDESVMKTDEKKLDKITDVNETYTNPFSISTSQTVSEKPSERMSPVQHLYPDVQLGQQRQKRLSLDNTRGVKLSDVMYDVVMIGDSCVGKTSFMKRAQSGKFSLDLPASVGLDSCIWTVIVDGKTMVLHLWDTAGQERFHSLTRQTFHKAQAFLLMYDVSSAESFSAVTYWINCIKEGAVEDVIVLLLGNKCDHTKRQVKTQQGEDLAKEYNFDFMECSAATGENVIESLETVARLLSQKAVTTEETVVLLKMSKESKPKNKSGCC